MNNNLITAAWDNLTPGVLQDFIFYHDCAFAMKSDYILLDYRSVWSNFHKISLLVLHFLLLMSQITAGFFFSGTCTTLYYVSHQATMSIKKSSTYFIYRSYLELVRCRFLICLPRLLQLHAWTLRWLYKPINKPTLKKMFVFISNLKVN